MRSSQRGKTGGLDDDGWYSAKGLIYSSGPSPCGRTSGRRTVAVEPETEPKKPKKSITHNTENYLVLSQPTCLWTVERKDPKNSIEFGNFSWWGNHDIGTLWYFIFSRIEQEGDSNGRKTNDFQRVKGKDVDKLKWLGRGFFLFPFR